MKTRTIPITLMALFAGVAVCFAADVNMGRWRLNEAKSKFAAGARKNHTVVYEAAGDDVRITVDGIDREGKPVHNEWTGKFDGKDYPVTGDASEDARFYERIDDRTLTFTSKKEGKVLTVTGRVAVSADDKTRTVTTSATDSKGKKISSTAVYDKQ